mmetsp:Transcript_19665/g.45848  ORF Transcript_19665/g.45848 Transcript_19665/m.45848 type:complete len:161 (+) Transcript_19665:780-1262(+)
MKQAGWAPLLLPPQAAHAAKLPSQAEQVEVQRAEQVEEQQHQPSAEVFATAGALKLMAMTGSPMVQLAVAAAVAAVAAADEATAAAARVVVLRVGVRVVSAGAQAKMAPSAPGVAPPAAHVAVTRLGKLGLLLCPESCSSKLREVVHLAKAWKTPRQPSS